MNSVPTTYTYFKNGANPLNGQRLSNDGTNAYTWDNNGSDLTRNGAPGNFSFAYSVDNRLTSISGAATASYTYDYQGRRTSKTVGGTTTTYLYDGLNLVTETTGANSVNYLFGQGIDEPLATYQSGALGYMSSDALGSVPLVSNAAGAVQNSYVFDAWGAARASTAVLTNSFGYTAREFGEAGLLGYRARYLQPGVGRFTQEDPSRFSFGTLHFFEYVRNRPTTFRDPTGLAAEDYGTNDCSYYQQQCTRFGGDYYCIVAPKWCNWFLKPPHPDWNTCTRKCLQDCDNHSCQLNPPEPSTGFWSRPALTCHVKCYVACAELHLMPPFI